MRRARVVAVIVTCALLACMSGAVAQYRLENLLERVDQLLLEDRNEEAMTLCDGILAEHPGSAKTYLKRGHGSSRAVR